MRALAVILLATSAAAADPLHVPVACRNWHSSHAIAGSLVGLGVDSYLHEVTPLGRVNRALVATSAALLVGYWKEHAVDHHARNEQVAPWGYGAAIACIGYEIHF